MLFRSFDAKKLSHHEAHNINKEWRNGGTDRLVQAEHTFFLTALTIKASVVCVNKKGLGNGWEKGGEKGQKKQYPRTKLLPISNQFNFLKGGFYLIRTEI